jgi:hypothetical protein
VDIAAGNSGEKEVVAGLAHALGRDFGMDHITLQAGQCLDGDCMNNCEEAPRS